MAIKFPHELLSPTEFSKELLEELLNEGYAAEQMIDGQKFIKMTSKYFEELGDYIKQFPKELCLEYWERLVDDTRNCDIMDFVRGFCETHLTIKKLTNAEVDFIEEISREL